MRQEKNEELLAEIFSKFDFLKGKPLVQKSVNSSKINRNKTTSEQPYLILEN